jgi:two-component system OmpR family response regulator
MARILLVEDDLALSCMIKDFLSARHYQVEHVSSGNDACYQLARAEFDLVILDMGLPDMSGVDVCRRYRQSGGTTAVLMLTGHRTMADKTNGFDAGTDDYLTKPFNLQELALRVQALMRRSRAIVVSDTVKVGTLELDPKKFCVSIDGRTIELLPKELALLEFLMRHPGEYFSSEALLNRVWSSESETAPDAVRQCVRRLRQKIDTADRESYIKSVQKLGYKLDVS